MCVLWGVPYLMIKVAVGGVSSPVLVFVRTAGAAVVLLPLAVRGLHWSVVRRHWVALLGFAVAEVIVPWGLLAEAERHLPSSLTGLIIAAVPMVAVLVGQVIGPAEGVGAQRWTGLVVGFLGVAVLAGPALSGGQAWGVVLMAPVVIGYAIGPVVVARWLRDVPNLVAVTLCMVVSALCYAPAAALTWRAAVGLGARGSGRPGRRVHRAGVRGVLRAAARGGDESGHGVHLRQPGSGGRGRGSWCSANRSPGPSWPLSG